MGDQAASHKGNTSWNPVAAIAPSRDWWWFRDGSESWLDFSCGRIQVLEEPIASRVWDFHREPYWELNRWETRLFWKIPLTEPMAMLYDNKSCSSVSRRGVRASREPRDAMVRCK